MVLANTLGDSPRNYGNRPVNTLKIRSCTALVIHSIPVWSVSAFWASPTLQVDSIKFKSNVEIIITPGPELA